MLTEPQHGRLWIKNKNSPACVWCSNSMYLQFFLSSKSMSQVKFLFVESSDHIKNWTFFLSCSPSECDYVFWTSWSNLIHSGWHGDFRDLRPGLESSPLVFSAVQGALRNGLMTTTKCSENRFTTNQRYIFWKASVKTVPFLSTIDWNSDTIVNSDNTFECWSLYCFEALVRPLTNEVL